MSNVLTVDELNVAMDDAASLIMIISVVSRDPQTVIRDALVAAYQDGVNAANADAEADVPDVHEQMGFK